MRKLPCLVAAAVISGMALAASPIEASPLASGLTKVTGAVPSVDDGLVQKVHAWHCRKKKGWFRGHKRWHRHWKACRDYDYSYHRPHYYYDPYPYSYGYGAPFITFEFGNRRHRRHHHWDDWDW